LTLARADPRHVSRTADSVLLILFYREDQSVERVAQALPMQMGSLAGASGAAEVAKSGVAAKAAR
jgi:hypothetical protein